MTPDGATTSVASILFDGPTVTAKVDALEQHIAELQKQNEYLKSTALYNRSFPSQLRGVLERLFDDCTDEPLPDNADIDAMYDRLKELFENDSDHEVWNPEREYDVTVTYTVTVTGRVTAVSASAAEDRVMDSELSFRLDDEGDLTDTDLCWERESIDVESA